MAQFIPRRQTGLGDALSLISLGQRQESLNRQRDITALKTAQTQEDRLDALNRLQGRGGIVNALGQLLGQENFLGTKDPLAKSPLIDPHAERLPEVSSIQRQFARQGDISRPVTTERFKEFLSGDRQFVDTVNQRAAAGPRRAPFGQISTEDIDREADAEVSRRLSGGDFRKALTGNIGDKKGRGSDSFKRFTAIDMARDQGVANPENLSDTELNTFLPNARKEVANKERTYKQAKSKVGTYNRILKSQEDFDQFGPSQYHQYILDGFNTEYDSARTPAARRKAISRYSTAVRSGDNYYLTDQARGLRGILANYPVAGIRGRGRGRAVKPVRQDLILSTAGGKQVGNRGLFNVIGKSLSDPRNFNTIRGQVEGFEDASDAKIRNAIRSGVLKVRAQKTTPGLKERTTVDITEAAIAQSDKDAKAVIESAFKGGDFKADRFLPGGRDKVTVGEFTVESLEEARALADARGFEIIGEGANAIVRKKRTPEEERQLQVAREARDAKRRRGEELIRADASFDPTR